MCIRDRLTYSVQYIDKSEYWPFKYFEFSEKTFKPLSRVKSAQKHTFRNVRFLMENSAKTPWQGLGITMARMKSLCHCCFRQPREEIQIGPNWDLSKALNNHNLTNQWEQLRNTPPAKMLEANQPRPGHIILCFFSMCFSGSSWVWKLFPQSLACKFCYKNSVTKKISFI